MRFMAIAILLVLSGCASGPTRLADYVEIEEGRMMIPGFIIKDSFTRAKEHNPMLPVGDGMRSELLP